MDNPNIAVGKGAFKAMAAGADENKHAGGTGGV